MYKITDEQMEELKENIDNIYITNANYNKIEVDKLNSIIKEIESTKSKAGSNAVLDEGFDIDVAIEDMGSCHRQKVACKECKMGRILFKAGGKDRIDDLCDKDMVYFCAKVVKTFI